MFETMIPSCFSQPNTPSSIISPTKTSHNHNHQNDHNNNNINNQNLITCIYQAQLFNTPTYITLTWSKTLTSHTLTVQASDNLFSLTISLRPPTLFSLFRPKPGSKSINPTHHHNPNPKLKLYSDFSRAEFAGRVDSAEPDSQFYLAIAAEDRIDFFVGDLLDELTRDHRLSPPRSSNGPRLVSRREHVFGRRSYVSRGASFAGAKREIGIECDAGTLRVRIDGVVRLAVKRLAWKFRGNEKIFVGNVEVDFFWDVFNWVDGGSHGGVDGGSHGGVDGKGHGVFVFQVGDGGVWPEMVGPERKLLRKSLSSSIDHQNKSTAHNNTHDNNNNYYYHHNLGSTALTYSPSCTSVLQWAEESSDGGSRRSSCSLSTRSSSFYSGNNINGGFSLMIYAWKKD